MIVDDYMIDVVFGVMKDRTIDFNSLAHDLGVQVENVKGFADAVGAHAVALVWENRIVMDYDLCERPHFRAMVLRHELKHILYVRRHGMTKKAGRRNLLLDLGHEWTGGIGIKIAAWLRKRALESTQ